MVISGKYEFPPYDTALSAQGFRNCPYLQW